LQTEARAGTVADHISHLWATNGSTNAGVLRDRTPMRRGGGTEELREG